MKCKILHESPNRMRVHLVQNFMSLKQADVVEYYLRSKSFVVKVKVYDRTGDAIIYYKEKSRDEVIKALALFAYTEDNYALVPENTSRELDRIYEDKLFFILARRLIMGYIIPLPLRRIRAYVRAGRYVIEGLKSLAKGKLEVSVLDATAITASLVTGDFNTASSIMFMLNVGDILEEWTHKKSVADLASTMSLNVDKAWVVTGETEVLVPVNRINVGDKVVVRTGNIIPLDGKVVSGEATVNQSSMTGESEPVRKCEGGYVYAGTVVEEGEIVFETDKALGGGKYDRIVAMIEESEKLKSNTESKAFHLADGLVPFTFLGTGLVYLLTRNVTKALAVLMVDYSCALKLSMPVAVLSAMKQAGALNITVKGGKFLEAIADADTIVFDKTGTLTHACPTVVDVVSFNNYDKDRALMLAACLEEHYPHSMASAVTRAAIEKGLNHEEEMHSKVEYIVAHGVASTVNDKKVVIGSRHFVFEDEGCIINDWEQEKFDSIDSKFSKLYLAIDKVLVAVICIDDPLREEAPGVVKNLHELGFSKVVMMTGDNEGKAKDVAQKLGLDEYHSEVLPEDKAAFIRKEHELGRKVVMIGDGINDSPALSEADAGIAISDGAAIAREVSDITIANDNLMALVELKKISDGMMERIKGNYRFIVTFNTMLIVLGVMGFIPPSTAALLHNSSTVAIGLKSTTGIDTKNVKKTGHDSKV